MTDIDKLVEAGVLGPEHIARRDGEECDPTKGVCAKCERVRVIVADGLCGTCHHRNERRINCREMWGKGRRGY